MQLDAERALEHADTALALLEPLGDRADPELLAGALTVRVRAGAVLGHGLDRELMDRALQLEARLPAKRVATEPVAYGMFGMWLRWVDQLDESRQLLERLVREAAASGHETSRAVGLMHLAATECLAGDLRLALEHAVSAFTIAEELEVGHVTALAAHSLAFVDAYLGNVDEARRLCERVRPFTSRAPGATIDLEATLGMLAGRHRGQ
jgi:hypothetical protein